MLYYTLTVLYYIIIYYWEIYCNMLCELGALAECTQPKSNADTCADYLLHQVVCPHLLSPLLQFPLG